MQLPKPAAARMYSIHEAKTHLVKLIEAVADGEEIIIARAGVPVARLVPVVVAPEARVLGTEKGRLVISDDFDAPFPPEVLAGRRVRPSTTIP